MDLETKRTFGIGRRGYNMTRIQENEIRKVRERIQEIRNILDAVMYYSEPLYEKDFGKIRGAYDLICKANDKL